jgi:hypothetical protein
VSLKRNNRKSAKYSLAQLFITSTKAEEDFHLSLYEADKLLKQRLVLITNFLSKLIPKFLLNFMYPGILFLPSSISGKVVISKEKEGTAVTIQENKLTKSYNEKVINKLAKEIRSCGFYILKRFVMLGVTGSSYHVGVARDSEHNLIFDLNGRIKNMGMNKNLTIVDASSLPYLQSGPITLSIMANSYRITSKMFE